MHATTDWGWAPESTLPPARPSAGAPLAPVLWLALLTVALAALAASVSGWGRLVAAVAACSWAMAAVARAALPD